MKLSMESFRDACLERRQMSEEYISVCPSFDEIINELLLIFIYRKLQTMFRMNERFYVLSKHKIN